MNEREMSRSTVNASERRPFTLDYRFRTGFLNEKLTGWRKQCVKNFPPHLNCGGGLYTPFNTVSCRMCVPHLGREISSVLLFTIWHEPETRENPHDGWKLIITESSARCVNDDELRLCRLTDDVVSYVIPLCLC